MHACKPYIDTGKGDKFSIKENSPAAFQPSSLHVVGMGKNKRSVLLRSD